MNDILEVLLFVLFALVNQRIGVKLHLINNRRRERRFLKYVRLENPDAIVVFSAIDSTDREALKKVKDQLDALS